MERMNKETLGQRTSWQIRWMLFRREMSASEMARRAGLTQSYVSRRLTGAAPFTLDDIERIAAALDVDVDTLMKIHSDQPDGGERRINERYREISPSVEPDLAPTATVGHPHTRPLPHAVEPAIPRQRPSGAPRSRTSWTRHRETA